MLKYIYRFDRGSAGEIVSPSRVAENVLCTVTRYVRGIWFHELTDPNNPRPLFAVLLADHMVKPYFEEIFESVLEYSGLRADILAPFDSETSLQLDLTVRASNATAFESLRTG